MSPETEKPSYRTSYVRVLAAPQTIDFRALMEGQRRSQEILDRAGLAPDPRPSIGNALAALATRTPEQLKLYVRQRERRRSDGSSESTCSAEI